MGLFAHVLVLDRLGASRSVRGLHVLERVSIALPDADLCRACHRAVRQEGVLEVTREGRTWRLRQQNKLTRSVSEGERSKTLRVRSPVKRSPSLTLFEVAQFAPSVTVRLLSTIRQSHEIATRNTKGHKESETRFNRNPCSEFFS